MLYSILENGQVIDEHLTEWEVTNLYPGCDAVVEA